MDKEAVIHIYNGIFSSGAQSRPTLCDPMNRSVPGLPVHHQLPEFTPIHVQRVSDAIQPSHPLSSPSPPTPLVTCPPRLPRVKSVPVQGEAGETSLKGREATQPRKAQHTGWSPPTPPSIRVFSNELTLHMRWPKYWSFSFSIIPSKEHPGLIFRLDLPSIFSLL